MNLSDRLFLQRANELAERGMGNTSPNPAVGAVVVRDGRIAGEGYHHRAGLEHAEVHALRTAGANARGATLYVSLEPCNHHGRTPPCSHAVVEAGVSRVVIGAADPNPRTAGGGIRYLREHGIEVELADDAQSRAIVEPFARAIRGERPYVALKMAFSLDGYVAPQAQIQHWLTGAQAREFTRELRTMYDAVAVGAGTIRVDDSQLTVRPPHHRLLPYRRIVFCETDPVDPSSAVLAARDDYDPTIIAAPAGARERFCALEEVAKVLYVGERNAKQLDLRCALADLRVLGITSILCEGGPTLASHLLAQGLVDRLYGLVAPVLLAGPQAVPVLARGELPSVPGLRFDRVEWLGPDLLVSACLAD